MNTACLVAKLFGKSWLNEGPWTHVLRLLLAPNELCNVTNRKAVTQLWKKKTTLAYIPVADEYFFSSWCK